VTYTRHIGCALTAARLLIRGWRIVGDYPPISPSIDVAMWMAIGPCPVPRRTP
jgi:hypothetical protein